MDLTFEKIDERRSNDEGIRFRIIQKIANDINLDGKKVVDLGTGHGRHAVLFADLGAKVTAIDRKTEREHMRTDSRVDWFLENVAEHDLSGFDVIFNTGLLYHLTLDEQIELLKRCSYTLNVVETHVVFSFGNTVEIESVYPKREHNPDGLIVEKGYCGLMFRANSFWHTEDSLLKLFQDSGFTKAKKIIPNIKTTRVFFILE